MGRLIVSEFVSLDGRFEGPPGQEMDWVRRHFSDELERDLAVQYERIGAFVMGRRTFDGLASYWPTPHAAHEHLADAMNDIPKLVVSSSTDVGAWPRSHHLGTRPLAALRDELAERGDIMLIGSRDVADQLAAAELVDEYRLLIFPEVLGRGRLLFPEEGPSSAWVTTRAERFGSGVTVVHAARRAHDV